MRTEIVIDNYATKSIFYRGPFHPIIELWRRNQRGAPSFWHRSTSPNDKLKTFKLLIPLIETPLQATITTILAFISPFEAIGIAIALYNSIRSLYVIDNCPFSSSSKHKVWKMTESFFKGNVKSDFLFFVLIADYVSNWLGVGNGR